MLGLNLRPYSLGHELWLIREQNPLSVAFGAEGIQALINGLPAAALFCSQSFDQIGGMNRDWFIGFKLWLWKLRLRKFKLGVELASFIEYRNRGTLMLPDEPDTTKQGRPFGAPVLLSLFQFIRRETRTDAEAWDYPYGLAQMRYAAWLESEGQMKIKNAYEMEHDRSFAEWEKQNPQSTLKEATDA